MQPLVRDNRQYVDNRILVAIGIFAKPLQDTDSSLRVSRSNTILTSAHPVENIGQILQRDPVLAGFGLALLIVSDDLAMGCLGIIAGIVIQGPDLLWHYSLGFDLIGNHCAIGV